MGISELYFLSSGAKKEECSEKPAATKEESLVADEALTGWRKAEIGATPGLRWIFNYPNNWHIVVHQSTETPYPQIIELSPEPILLNLVNIKDRCVISINGYHYLVDYEKEMEKMLLETKNKMKNIKESSSHLGQNIIYKLEGEFLYPPGGRNPASIYYLLLSFTDDEGKTEKSVIKAELNFNWPLNSPHEQEYPGIFDQVVKSFGYEKTRGGASQ